MKIIQWTGTVPTRIRTERLGEKVEIYPGGSTEISDDMAEYYINTDSNFVLLPAVPEMTVDMPRVQHSTVIPKKRK